MSSPPFTVKAIFEYASSHDDDLSFPIGQIITVTAIEDAEWYSGEYTDNAGSKHEGIFPKNFVERYEPPAPPRPSRPNRPKKEPETATVPASESIVSSPASEVKSPLESAPPAQEDFMSKSPPPASPAPVADVPPAMPKPVPTGPSVPTAASAEPVEKSSARPAPPVVADKPSGSSFKDRIAAFNKPAAPPIAPFKPGGFGGQNTSQFIKKPFVAPPPSKNAYVAPPREPPPKTYRREEDPDIAERTPREPPASEARSAPTEGERDDAQDQPKPTSLKERIALLQKQQLEQAARLAEAAQKKEKPKRPPPKKRAESHDPSQVAESADLEKTDTSETARDRSVDTVKPGPPVPAQLASDFTPGLEVASDPNDADYSAAADTEDADETSTSKEDLEDRKRGAPRTPAVERRSQDMERGNQGVDDEEDEESGQEEAEGARAGEEDEDEEGEEEPEEEMDPEVKRRMELRERMAKMSGGMGMMGLFGPPGGMPGMGAARKSKHAAETERRSQEHERAVPPSAPPVPVMALPGMSTRKQAEPAPEEVEEEADEPQATPIAEQRPPEEVPDVEDVVPDEPRPRVSTDRAAPPVPQDRSLAPLPPTETRPPPPARPTGREAPAAPPVPGSRPGPAAAEAADSGEVSDDELSLHPKKSTGPPSVPAPPIPDHIDARAASSYDVTSPKSHTMGSEKRSSRVPPPVPTNAPLPPPAQSRPAPPPPATDLRRQSTTDSRLTTSSLPRQAGEESEGEVTEYDGDYDTDIASGAKFKDALKSHARDSSIDDGTLADDMSLRSPKSPAESRHPPPQPPSAPRGVPPPPPSQPPRGNRSSMDIPRGPPPPPPPAREESYTNDDEDEYDPYRYTAPRHGLPAPPPVPAGRPEAPPPPPPQAETAADDDEDEEDEEVYETSPVQPPPRPPHEKRASVVQPPPMPSQAPAAAAPQPTPRSQRASMDLLRGPSNVRRSMDMPRPSVDQGYIAADVDLAEHSLWWAQPNTPPPAFQNRNDVFYEMEESTSTKRGGKTTVSKDVYVLFMDYSQSVITVHFDARNPSDASLEQRHEPPPHPPRQDQLEAAHSRIGTRISAAVTEIQNTTVADGTPSGLIQHLLTPLTDALMPVGTRAYGALVYSNLANASVQQRDEIRAGDIVSFRNARFQGHRGTMHQKYTAEIGKPDHVGVVVDWDGTKKKIRAWEQGRESKKVKMESFKLNDLKSGECKVWRVMPRSWIGWENDK